jgi:hypothetical protein
VDLRLQIFAAGGSLLLLVVVFELVRRKRLLERYALLWLFSGLVLLLLAVWRKALSGVADAIGIYYPPSALFTVAFAFVLLLLLHFSLAVSRLTDQSKVLAQRLALLEERLRGREQAETLARVAPGMQGRGERQGNGERGGNGERRVGSSSRRTSDQ